MNQTNGSMRRAIARNVMDVSEVDAELIKALGFEVEIETETDLEKTVRETIEGMRFPARRRRSNAI